jgi:hypothetical protein
MSLRLVWDETIQVLNHSTLRKTIEIGIRFDNSQSFSKNFRKCQFN